MKTLEPKGAVEWCVKFHRNSTRIVYQNISHNIFQSFTI